MSEDFETSIPLKKKFFTLIDAEMKTTHIDKKDYGLEEGDIIRFMKGYNPDNGVVFREVGKVIEKKACNITVLDLFYADVSSNWIIDYVGDLSKKLYIYVLKEVDSCE